MNKSAMLAAAVWLACVGAAWSFDSVKTTKTTIPGRIRSMTPTQVELEGSGGVSRTIPVNEIVMVFFDEEPSQLRTAKTNILSGRFEDALAALEKLDPAQIGRSEIRQELEFYKAYSKAKLALGGTGEITAAGSEMAGFINSYRNSFHWLEANQLVGDLLVANGAYDKAEAYYREVAQAPFPDAKMRAGVAMGRAMLAQGKTAEARTQYEQVLKEKAEGELAQSQQMSATLGIARCLVADGKAAEAVQMVQPVIDKAAPEETRLLAEAYNTLGTAQRAAGQNQEALMAFLHVDLLYFADPEAHAEALSNLVQLWRQLQKPEREMRARELLEQRYRNSVWAKKLG